MSKLRFTCLGFIIALTFSQFTGTAQGDGEWSLITGPGFRDMNAITVLDNGFWFGAGGRLNNDAISSIMRSNDGGKNWHFRLDEVNAQLTDVVFISDSIGVMAGWDGTVYRTEDVGLSWTRIVLQGNLANRHYNSLSAVNGATIFAAGGNVSNDSIQTIMRSDDGGLTWNLVRDALAPILYDLEMLDQNNGYAVGGHSSIIKTVDGGSNWTEVAVPGTLGSRDFRDIHFRENDAWIVGGIPGIDSVQTVLRSDDGGESWASEWDSIGPMLYAIDFIEDRGFTAGDNGVIYYTANGGDDWNQVFISPMINDALRGLRDVVWIKNELATFSGADGKILRYEEIEITPPFVETGDAMLINSNSLLFSAKVNPQGFETTVVFEYGIDSLNLTDSIEIAQNPVNGTELQDVSALLEDVDSETTYYYRAIATNMHGTVSGATRSVFSGARPLVETGDATLLDPNSIRFSGSVNPNGFETTVVFKYGVDSLNLTDSIDIAQNPVNGTEIQDVSAVLTGIDTETTYYYRAVATNVHGTASGATRSIFIGIPPLVETGDATIINPNSIKFSGSVNPNGDETMVVFEYGTDSENLTDAIVVDQNPVNGTEWQDVSAVLMGINLDEAYYYRTVATNLYGTAEGAIRPVFPGNNPIPNWDFEEWDSVIISNLKEWGIFGAPDIVESYNGTNALKLQGVEDAGPAVIYQGNVGQMGPSGYIHFPYKPDSLTGYFNYNIQDGDIARIWIQLADNAGVKLVDTIYILSGNTDDEWTRLSLPIEYETDGMPDSLFILLTSTDVFGETNNESVMIVDDLIFSGADQGAIPNGDFEEVDQEELLMPVNWYSGRPAPDTAGAVLVRTSNSQHGNYALKLRNTERDWGRASLNMDASLEFPAFPIKYAFNTFSGYYSFRPASEHDSLAISIRVFQEGVTVGAGQVFISGENLEYKKFEIEINPFAEPFEPDSANISISLFGMERTPSYALIDNLFFDGVVSGTKDAIVQDQMLEIFPNPTDGQITIRVPETIEDSAELEIYSISGQPVLTRQIENLNKELSVNARSLGAGTYVAVLKYRTGVHVGLFVVL